MSDRDERIACGEAMFDEVYGGIVPLPSGEYRNDYIEDMLGHLFGEVWPRDGLALRDKRLMVIGAVIALGEAGILEIQLRSALKKGELTREQLPEILIFMVNYVGYPRAGQLQQVIGKILAEGEKLAAGGQKAAPNPSPKFSPPY